MLKSCINRSVRRDKAKRIMTVTHNGKQYTAKKLNDNEWQLTSVSSPRKADAEPLADAYRWPPETG
jgi:hypothetical protein